MADVVYENASRIYPGSPPVKAVNRVNLEIKDGEFLVLVGPSGSGKSTALRMLAGLEEVNEGRILIGGRDVTNVPPKNRDIAMVFQSYALYPHMSVADNMGFALKLKGVDKATIATKVKEAAGLLDLGKYLDRKPKALSGGQRQRVAMGRAIVREPAVFLMDEPLSNLDAKLRVETRANIAELQSRLGTTTVYVTHDQVEAMTMGHRVAVLQAGGFLQQVDTPRALYDRPANLMVAGFIGSPAMNLVKLKVTESGVKFGGEDVPLKAPIMEEIKSKGLTEVMFGVRPEALDLNEPGMNVTIDLVEELGADAYVHAHTPDGDRIVIRADPRLQLHQGATVKVHVSDLENVHVFHAESGERLGASAGL